MLNVRTALSNECQEQGHGSLSSIWSVWRAGAGHPVSETGRFSASFNRRLNPG